MSILILLILDFDESAAGALTISKKGIKLGAGLTNYRSENKHFGYEWKAGFCAGGFISLKVNDYISVQPEILYTAKSTQSKNIAYYGIDVVYRFEVNIHEYMKYIELPILCELTLSRGEYVLPNFYVGPYFAYILSQKYKEEPPVPENGHVPYYTNSGPCKDVDYGLVFGGSFDFKFIALLFTIDLRYTYGMSNLYESDYYERKNNGISIMMGVCF